VQQSAGGTASEHVVLPWLRLVGCHPDGRHQRFGLMVFSTTPRTPALQACVVSVGRSATLWNNTVWNNQHRLGCRKPQRAARRQSRAVRQEAVDDREVRPVLQDRLVGRAG
jgi:hypothetical protein